VLGPIAVAFLDIGQRGVQPLQQRERGFLLAAYKRDTYFFANLSERGASDRRDFTDGELAVSLFEEGLAVILAYAGRGR